MTNETQENPNIDDDMGPNVKPNIDENCPNEKQIAPVYGNPNSQTEKLLAQILRVLKDREAVQKVKKERELTMADWVLVAMVVDRFMFIAFIVITIAFTWVILTNYPTMDDKFEIPE